MSQKTKPVKLIGASAADAIGPIHYNANLENKAIQVVGHVLAVTVAVIIVKVFVVSLVKSVLIVAGFIVVTLIVVHLIHKPQAFKTVSSFTLTFGAVLAVFIYLGTMGGK